MSTTDHNSQPVTRETTVVNTGGGGGSAFLLIGILLAVVAAGIYFYSGGEIPSAGTVIDVDVGVDPAGPAEAAPAASE